MQLCPCRRPSVHGVPGHNDIEVAIPVQVSECAASESGSGAREGARIYIGKGAVPIVPDHLIAGGGRIVQEDRIHITTARRRHEK
jgi:hypothetical protein